MTNVLDELRAEDAAAAAKAEQERQALASQYPQLVRDVADGKRTNPAEIRAILAARGTDVATLEADVNTLRRRREAAATLAAIPGRIDESQKLGVAARKAAAARQLVEQEVQRRLDAAIQAEREAERAYVSAVRDTEDDERHAKDVLLSTASPAAQQHVYDLRLEADFADERVSNQREKVRELREAIEQTGFCRWLRGGGGPELEQLRQELRAAQAEATDLRRKASEASAAVEDAAMDPESMRYAGEPDAAPRRQNGPRYAKRLPAPGEPARAWGE